MTKAKKTISAKSRLNICQILLQSKKIMFFEVLWGVSVKVKIIVKIFTCFGTI